MTNHTRGILNGIISGISFGLIPMFSIPVIAAGMADISIIVYRFLFGSLGMLAMLLYQRIDLHISLDELWRIALLSLFYNGTAIATISSYHYLSSGIATALVYTDPIWCAIIGLLFLGAPFSRKITSSIFLATLGVMMLSGIFSQEGSFSAVGIGWGLLSGLSYALYIIVLPRLRLKEMPSLKLTFYVFFIGMFLIAAYDIVFEGGIEAIPDSHCWLNLILLGLIPTALSNICVTVSLRLIDSTVVAILGALEPLTAMVVGIVILGEPLNMLSITGALLILVAVGILTIRKK